MSKKGPFKSLLKLAERIASRLVDKHPGRSSFAAYLSVGIWSALVLKGVEVAAKHPVQVGVAILFITLLAVHTIVYGWERLLRLLRDLMSGEPRREEDVRPPKPPKPSKRPESLDDKSKQKPEDDITKAINRDILDPKSKPQDEDRPD
jgi:hypothetical protein